MSYIDTSNRNDIIRVRCLTIDPGQNRIVFAGPVETTVVRAFGPNWLLAMWEKVDGVWNMRGNWTAEANVSCLVPPPPGRPFIADAGSLEFFSVP